MALLETSEVKREIEVLEREFKSDGEDTKLEDEIFNEFCD